MGINHTSVLAKADFFHTCEYIHIQLANSNIVKTSDLFRKEDLAEVESEVGVKYWIGGTTGETGFHSILFASFYPGEDPSGTLVEISSLASRERSQQVSRLFVCLVFCCCRCFFPLTIMKVRKVKIGARYRIML